MWTIKNFKSSFVRCIIIILLILLSFDGGCRCQAENGKFNEKMESYLLRMDHVIKSVVFGEELVRNRTGDAKVLHNLPLISNLEQFHELLNLFRRKSLQSANFLRSNAKQLIATANRDLQKSVSFVMDNMGCVDVMLQVFAGLQSIKYFAKTDSRRRRLKRNTLKLVQIFDEIEKKNLSIDFSISNNKKKFLELREAIFEIFSTSRLDRRQLLLLNNYYYSFYEFQIIQPKCEKFFSKGGLDIKFAKKFEKTMWTNYKEAQTNRLLMEPFFNYLATPHDEELKKKFIQMINDMKWLLGRNYITKMNSSISFSRKDEQKEYTELPIELSIRVELAEDLLEVYGIKNNLKIQEVPSKLVDVFEQLHNITWDYNAERFSNLIPNLQSPPDLYHLEEWLHAEKRVRKIKSSLKNVTNATFILKGYVEALNIPMKPLKEIVERLNFLMKVGHMHYLLWKAEVDEQFIEIEQIYHELTIPLFDNVISWLNSSNTAHFSFNQTDRTYIENTDFTIKEKVEMKDRLDETLTVGEIREKFNDLFLFLKRISENNTESVKALDMLTKFVDLDKAKRKIKKEEEKKWWRMAKDWAEFQFSHDLEVDPGLNWLVDNSEYETVIEKGVEAFQKVCEINRNATNETNETNNNDFSIIEWFPEESSRKMDIVLSKLNQSIEWLDLKMKISESANISDRINWETLSNNIRNMTQFLEKWNKMVKQKHTKFLMKQFDINITKFSDQSNTFKNKTTAVKTDIFPFIRKTSGIFGCFLSVCNLILVFYIIYKSFGRISKQKKKH